MKTIYLITDVFPYGVGEQFLETEVPYLADVLHLVILPKSRSENRRKVPQGVVVDHALVCNPGGFSIIYPALFSLFFYKELARRPKTLFSPRDMKKLLAFLSAGIRQFKILRGMLRNKTSGDVVLYSYWSWETAFAFSMLKKEFPVVLMVSRAHRYDIYAETHINYYMPIQKKYLNDLDVVCAVSSHGQRYLRDNYPLKGDNIKVCRLGVDDPHVISRFNADCIHLVTCSYIKRVKRLDRLIESLKYLENLTDLSLKWTHIGDGEDRAYIQYLAKSLLMKIEINWMGQVENVKVKSFYKEHAIDCFVNTSDSEGIPVSIMEALSYGIPVVATDVGGVSEIVDHSNGKLIPIERSAMEIAEAILEVSSKNSQSYRRKIKSEWKAKYCSEINYRKFIKNINHLVPKGIAG